MEALAVVIQVVIALGIYNVWLLRRSRPTAWRGGEAQNIQDEFAVYGLPAWFMKTIGFSKLLLATLLLAGIWFPDVTRPAAAGLALLMLGAVVMHVKVKDPIYKSLPAFSLLVLSAFVAVT